MRQPDPRTFTLVCLICAGCALKFDLNQAFGVAGGVAYVLLVLPGLLANRVPPVIVLALTATGLALVGHALSAPGEPETPVLMARGPTLVVIWAVAAAVAIVIAQRRRLRWMLDRDVNTGLFNRRFLGQRLQCEVDAWSRNRSSLSLIMLDIDHFKAVNDRFGHVAGDRVLQAVARVCQANVRGTDYVCRYGGEEFAVLLPNTDGPMALSIARRLRRALAHERIAIAGRKLCVTASFGVAELTEAVDTAGALLVAADKALYRAKGAGRDRVAAGAGASGARELFPQQLSAAL